jgi:hypothetical protein
LAKEARLGQNRRLFRWAVGREKRLLAGPVVRGATIIDIPGAIASANRVA